MSIFKISFLVMTVAAMTSQSVTAADQRNKESAHRDNGVSLERAVSRARNEYQGRILSAETDRQNGHSTHNIRILTDDGRVRRLRVDSDTGEYIRPNRRPSGR